MNMSLGRTCFLEGGGAQVPKYRLLDITLSKIPDHHFVGKVDSWTYALMDCPLGYGPGDGNEDTMDVTY